MEKVGETIFVELSLFIVGYRERGGVGAAAAELLGNEKFQFFILQSTFMGDVNKKLILNDT